MSYYRISYSSMNFPSTPCLVVASTFVKAQSMGRQFYKLLSTWFDLPCNCLDITYHVIVCLSVVLPNEIDWLSRYISVQLITIKITCYCPVTSTMFLITVGLICLSSLFRVSCLSSNVHMHTRLVNEILRNEDRPSLLNVLSCWSHDDMAKFLKYSTATAVFLPHLHRVNLTLTQVAELHQNWFLVMMDCSGSLEFLRQASILL